MRRRQPMHRSHRRLDWSGSWKLSCLHVHWRGTRRKNMLSVDIYDYRDIADLEGRVRNLRARRRGLHGRSSEQLYRRKRHLRLLCNCQPLPAMDLQRQRIVPRYLLCARQQNLHWPSKLPGYNLQSVDWLLRTGASDPDRELHSRFRLGVQICWLEHSHLCPAAGHCRPSNHLYHPNGLNSSAALFTGSRSAGQSRSIQPQPELCASSLVVPG